jgi:hypothetical protein
MAFDARPLHDAIVAVCPILGVSVGDPANKATWTIQYDPAATAQQRTNAQAAITAFDPNVVSVPLELIQTRMEAEPISATNAWETYVNFVFGTNARRNAFLKIMFIGKPIRQDNTVFRTSMTNAGIAAAAQDRILAAP